MQTTSDAIAGIANYFKKMVGKEDSLLQREFHIREIALIKGRQGNPYKYSRASLKGISPKHGK